MKKSFSLNVLLLSFLLLIGSIVEINSSLVSINSQSFDSAKEIEDLTNYAPIITYFTHFNPTQILIELPALFVLALPTTHFHSSITQLLCSNRIALPPPFLI